MPEYRIHILTEPRSSDVKEWEVVPCFVDFPTAYFLPITRFMASR